jgi:hypothetical protein
MLASEHVRLAAPRAVLKALATLQKHACWRELHVANISVSRLGFDGQGGPGGSQISDARIS